MIDLAGNFPGKSEHRWCKLCLIFFEVQEHLMNCWIIRERLKNKVNFLFSYSDIEGPLHLQEKFAQTYTIILTTREDILSENSPNGVHSTGRGIHHSQDATNRKTG